MGLADLTRGLAALALLLPLAGCAGGDDRAFAGGYPYGDFLPLEGLGYDADAIDEESMVGSSIRGVIDDDLGLPDGNLH